MISDELAGSLTPFEQNPDKILVALSGGVDSSVCVRILQDQGFAVEGLVISFSPAHAGAVAAAQLAAAELGIPLTVEHCEPLFEQEVVTPFCQAYANGQTPNPCVMCNPGVKFDILAKVAKQKGIPYIASGHYARMEEKDGIFYVARAASLARDQSYMLYRLPQTILSRLCLPVGEFEKPLIREMANAYGLSSANSPDSQEICFIPDGDYATFIENRGITGKQGHFIGPDGENLGAHKGVLHYTVGQRRGIGLALGKPIFVKAILPSGDIQLGWAGQEFASTITLQNTVTTTGQPLVAGAEYQIKIRSRAELVPCRTEYFGDDECRISFPKPQRAPAPGQSAVLYQDDCVMGGGVIV
ncbi:tRNA 2-thiouridine(34) synthase MnmA [Ruminococcaceae bacterium OttesenSCG-928-A16]|nr:tRNA 2-thiouridine(34) synthase MnmA [Ruminococcaceae bacterium OttesenSCG-928-A16]